MTDQDLEKLSDLIVQKSVHPPKCIAFTDQDIEGIKALACAYNEGQKAFRRGVITLIVIGSIITFLIGLHNYLKSLFEK